MGRGRKEKQTFADPEDRFEDLISKLYTFDVDADGRVTVDRTNYVLGFDDLAFMMWMHDGRPTKGPLTKMGMLKQVAAIAQKLHMKLLKSGFTDDQLRDILEVMSKSGRQSAQCYDRVEMSDD